MILNAGEMLAQLMKRYDHQFPDASEFHRGSFKFECEKVLDAMAREGVREFVKADEGAAVFVLPERQRRQVMAAVRQAIRHLDRNRHNALLKFGKTARTEQWDDRLELLEPAYRTLGGDPAAIDRRCSR